jgi:acylglycerol lipase
MKIQTDTMTMPDGTVLATQAWVPESTITPKGVIVLAHGYAEHVGRYAHVGEYLTREGYLLTGLDQRGHGRSKANQPGYFDRFQTLVDDQHHFVRNLPSVWRSLPLYMLGHSMGGLLTLYYSIRYSPPVRGIITSGAALDIGADVPGLMRSVLRQLSGLLPTLGVAQVDSSTISKDQAVVKAYEGDPYVYRGKVPARVGIELYDAGQFVRQALNKIERPILILHGGVDRLINPRCSEWVYEGVSSADKTKRIYDGLNHEILNEPEKLTVLDDIKHWLATH